jgi:hypothetical protein
MIVSLDMKSDWHILANIMLNCLQIFSLFHLTTFLGILDDFDPIFSILDDLESFFSMLDNSFSRSAKQSLSCALAGRIIAQNRTAINVLR